MKKKTTFLQEGSISLSLIGLGILVISAIVLPLASKLVSTRTVSQQKAVEQTSPACNGLTLSLTEDQKIKADFTLSGNGDASAKLVAGIFYRIYDDINSPGSNWVKMGDLYSDAGNVDRQTITRFSDIVQKGVTYEVAGSINVFYDTNGNDQYDVGETRDVCSGKVDSSIWENNDCPTKITGNCFKSIEIPLAAQTPTPTPTIAPPACLCQGTTRVGTPGDADCNGGVNLIDFEIWREESNNERTTQNADFNCNGYADREDYGIWLQNFR